MIKLLDCTLRDGGYYTSWDFDISLVNKYSILLSKLPIDYIEIGYKSIEKADYLGEYFYISNNTLTRIRNNLDKSQKISLMINAKDCESIDISKLVSECIDNVDMFRIATNPDNIDASLKIAKTLKSHGFEVGLNIMYISKINNNHKIYDKIQDIDSYVDYLYLVDSYGAIYPNELENIIVNFQKSSKVKLGFHGHNNIELALINTLKAIECGVELIDSTILGMGRGAGNLKLELLLVHLKARKHWNVNLTVLSTLVELFQPLKNYYKWGSNLAYIVSGEYSLPQKDVMDAIEIDRYSIASIVSSMNKQEQKKLDIFQDDQKDKNCVIIGGGDTIIKHEIAIMTYLKKNKDIVIIHSSSKYIENFSTLKNQQFFCITGNELTKLENINKYDFVDKFIFEPSPRKISIKILNNKNSFELNQVEFTSKYTDSPLTISLQVALDMHVSNIELIGFDGYKELKSKKEWSLMKENQEIISMFVDTFKGEFSSLTKTNYKDILQKSIYAKVVI